MIEAENIQPKACDRENKSWNIGEPVIPQLLDRICCG